MEYSVLTMGLSNQLTANLQALIVQYKLQFIAAHTIKEANQLLCFSL